MEDSIKNYRNDISLYLLNICIINLVGKTYDISKLDVLFNKPLYSIKRMLELYKPLAKNKYEISYIEYYYPLITDLYKQFNTNWFDLPVIIRNKIFCYLGFFINQYVSPD